MMLFVQTEDVVACWSCHGVKAARHKVYELRALRPGIAWLVQDNDSRPVDNSPNLVTDTYGAIYHGHLGKLLT